MDYQVDYKESGVDTQRGYELVERLKRQGGARDTAGGRVLGGIGGFASLYALAGYKEPVLVSGTDGVGTKLKLALDFASYESIGQDCVAMCVNDVICTGAQPLFFLDYLACDKLDVEIASALIGGIFAACERIGIPLIGGETAEMPGFYQNGLYDMAGFCVGAVERSAIRSKELVQNGDVIIGPDEQRFAFQRFFAGAKNFKRSRKTLWPDGLRTAFTAKKPRLTPKRKRIKSRKKNNAKA